jgi:hypothetical protein
MTEPALTLTDLVEDPDRAAALPRVDVVRLYRQAARLEAELRALLLVAAAQPHAPADRPAPPGSELTVEQVSQRIHRPAAYVRELLRRKDLPGYRRGRYWVIPEAALSTGRNGGLDCAGPAPQLSGGRRT